MVHTFSELPDEDLVIELPESECRTINQMFFDETTKSPRLESDHLILPKGNPFRGYVFLFYK